MLVGYGDIYPRTDLGRLVMFFCSLVGVVIISIMVVAVTNELEMSSLQSKAFTVIKKISIKEKMKHEAASVLGKAARLYLNIKKHRSIKAKNVYKLNRKILRFKKLRR